MTSARGTAKFPTDRRMADRFPLERDARFKVLDTRATPETGTCRTINMSSRGILFSTRGRLCEDTRLELALSWPALLNDTCPLKLVAQGRIVRSNEREAAIEIERYDFRTQGAAGV